LEVNAGTGGVGEREQMANHYLNIIEQGLRQYNGAFSNEIYEALAWRGLMGSGAIDQNTGLPPNPVVTWENLPQQVRIDLINGRLDFMDDNPNCQ